MTTKTIIISTLLVKKEFSRKQIVNFRTVILRRIHGFLLPKIATVRINQCAVHSA